MNQPADITEEESKAIDGVDLEQLTGEGNDSLRGEDKPKGKGKKKKGQEVEAVSPANQNVDGTIELEPDITSTEWHDYVIRQLNEDEKDGDGNPYVHGLRRITQLLIGPIIESRARVVQSPTFVESIGNLQPAVVEYTVRVINSKTPPGIDPYEIVVTDVADVYHGNTDPEFARYSTAMAATRAKGRCFREILQLKRVAAAEELTNVPLDESGVNGLITPTQINFIDLLARRLKIDVMKYINMGSKQYSSIEEVSYASGAKMNEHLHCWINDPSKIPAEIKGYKLDWQASE